MTTFPHYDLAIVGSGGAAFATAIEARRLGASVVVIERATVGGTCVNVGCVPSKALLAAADAHHRAAHAPFAGVNTSAEPVDLAALVAEKDQLVAQLRQEKYVELAALHGFELRSGVARFVDGPALDVDGARLGADHFVIATGASPSPPPIPGLDQIDYLTSTSAMDLAEAPRSLLVIGAGAVGLEQAQLFARLGARVTLVEARERLAPDEEPELSDALAGVLGDEGVDVRPATTVRRIDRQRDGILVALEGPAGVEDRLVDAVLVATGRRPATNDLNLESVGVGLGARGEVVVDDELRTSHPRIFAAGDVTGAPQYVYVAGRHGTVVANNALAGAHDTVNYRSLPRVTFTTPAVAAVGLTEARARDLGVDCESRVLPFAHLPRALVSRDTRGVAKIVAERASGRLLGVHLFAEGAGDAILAAVYALDAGASVEQLANAWTPYLTVAEAIKLTAQSFTREVAALSCCAS